MDREQALIAMLDRNKPQWYIEWADTQDLRQLATGMATPASLKSRLVRRIAHVVLHAAYCAGQIIDAPE